jgi:lipopolysaccharide export LptBFGC system permease protein LptF
MTADLWRLMILAALVMVLVIAFAATVKPLAEGTLDPGNALRFMLYAMPPMLAYALPFAAGFGATLVYHRMATDNEALAAHAGGVSHRAFMAPAYFTAFVLTVGGLFMHDQVIPDFLHRMQRMITVDLSRLVASEVARGNAIKQKNLLIFADQGKSFGPDAATGALDRVVLGRFAAIELDRDGNPSTEASSNAATMWLFPADEADAEPGTPGAVSKVVLRLQNVVALKQNSWTSGSKDTMLRWTVPYIFRDSVAFFPYAKLREVQRRPEMMSLVNMRRLDLAYTLGRRECIERLNTLAREKGGFELIDANGAPVTIRARGITFEDGRMRLIDPRGDGAVSISVIRGFDEKDRRRTDISSRDIELAIDIGEDQYSRRLELELKIRDAKTREIARDGTQGDGASRGELNISGLRMPPDESGADFMQPLLDASVGSLLKFAEPASSEDPAIGEIATNLRARVRTVELRTLSKINDRIALSVSGGIAIIVGALAALSSVGRSPLLTYMWSFLPAVMAIMTIQGGTQYTNASGEIGLLIVWSSPVLLAGYSVFLYRRLARH